MRTIEDLLAVLARTNTEDQASVLLGALRESGAEVRALAALELGALPEAAGETTPALIRALLDDREPVCAAAAEALGKLGPHARAAVPALATALRFGELNVRFEAALALGAIGPYARPAVPVLLRASCEPGGPCFQAVEALERILRPTASRP